MLEFPVYIWNLWVSSRRNRRYIFGNIYLFLILVSILILFNLQQEQMLGNRCKKLEQMNAALRDVITLQKLRQEAQNEAEVCYINFFTVLSILILFNL